MEKCSPSEMRRNLLVVQKFVDTGMDFVVIPVKSLTHKKDLIEQAESVFSELIIEAEL